MTCRKKHTIENDWFHLFASSWLAERNQEIGPTQSDVTLCPGCGGRLRLVAVLSGVGLAADPPALARKNHNLN